MTTDPSGLDVLDRATCLQLLGQAELGRVGLCQDGRPAVLPVRFQLGRDRILFRTGRGSKLAAATLNAVVAFEVDHLDPTDRTGWSVLVVGVARDVSDEDMTPHERFRLARWAPGAEDRIVAVHLDEVTGRRLPASALPRLGAPRPTGAGATAEAEPPGPEAPGREPMGPRARRGEAEAPGAAGGPGAWCG